LNNFVPAQSKPYDLATAEHDYPDWPGAPARSVLICTHPRSGSTLLGEILYFAGDLGCPLEYFHIGFRPRFEARWGVSEIGEFSRAVWRHRTGPNGVLSTKLMWRDIQELAMALDPEGLAEIESAPPDAVSPDTYARVARLIEGLLPSPVCVHLYRRDRLRQAVSATIATQTGQWRAIPGAEMVREREPEYDAETITRLIGYSDFCHGHWRNLIAAMEGPSLSIAYEDMVRDYPASTDALLAELGSSQASPPIRMRRQADRISEAFVMRYLRERGLVSP
jgi:LPS sulfotransferase NodH